MPDGMPGMTPPVPDMKPAVPGISTPDNPMGSKHITTPGVPSPTPPNVFDHMMSAVKNPLSTIKNVLPGASTAANAMPSAPAISNGAGHFAAGLMGGQKAQDLHQILGQYNVPEADRWQLMSGFNQLQQASNSGDYLGAYNHMMGLQGKLKGYNPALPGAISPFLEKHQGGWAPTLWNAGSAWHNMVGDPGRFAQLAGSLAPGVLQASGVAGPAGPLALYGMLSGNQQVIKDLKTLVTPTGR